MEQHSLVQLTLSEAGSERLTALIEEFAAATRLAYRIAEEQSLYGRIALHHAAYNRIRVSYPKLGSQLAENCIYLVSSFCKKDVTSSLPALWERPPVILDRRTVSVLNGSISIFTLEGRMRISATLPLELNDALQKGVFKEIHLYHHTGYIYLLKFFIKPKIEKQT